MKKLKTILKQQSSTNIIISDEMIEEKIFITLKNHIGEGNKISKENLFEEVVGVNPNSNKISSFNAYYLWEKMEKMIRKLRKSQKCFILKKKGFYFVLQTQVEADYYKELCDKTILRLENAKVKSDIWVENIGWKAYKDTPSPLKVDFLPEPELVISTLDEKSILQPFPKSTNELKVDIEKDELPTFKQKIIKLYKGEK